MKVIIATATSPFIYGGATLLVDWLDEALRARGHETEIYRIPVYPSPDDLPAQMVGLRHWDFTGHGDRLITIRTPSYLIRHHHKVVWFLHHHRPAYDLWDQYPDVPDTPSGHEFRRMMFASDEVALAECRSIFVNSARVGERLRHFNEIESEVLYPPLGGSMPTGPAHTSTPGYRDSLVYVSRVVPHKRQLLAIQAMAHTQTGVKLIVAGGVSSADYRDAIYREIDRLDLGERVSFIDEVISEDRKQQLLAEALGVVYVPLDEDSYGFVGLEAAAVARPLVTTTDSGGVLELVQDGVNGYVCEPSPEDLARGFDALYSDAARATSMGAALEQRVKDLNISWDHVVDRLLA